MTAAGELVRIAPTVTYGSLFLNLCALLGVPLSQGTTSMGLLDSFRLVVLIREIIRPEIESLLLNLN